MAGRHPLETELLAWLEKEPGAGDYMAHVRNCRQCRAKAGRMLANLEGTDDAA